MSFKLQAIAMLATTGAIAGVATPLTLQSKSIGNDFAFTFNKLSQLVEDASENYKSSEGSEQLKDIIFESKIQEFVKLTDKIREGEKKDNSQGNTEKVSLSKEERDLMSAFYAAFSLLDSRVSVAENNDNHFEIKEGLFKNNQTVKILSSLEELGWSKDSTNLEDSYRKSSSGWDNSLLRNFYESSPQENKSKSESEITYDIANWLLKDMELIYKNRSLSK